MIRTTQYPLLPMVLCCGAIALAPIDFDLKPLELNRSIRIRALIEIRTSGITNISKISLVRG